MATPGDTDLVGTLGVAGQVSRDSFPKLPLQPLGPDSDFCYIECHVCHAWFASDDFSTIRMRCDDCRKKYGVYEQPEVPHHAIPNLASPERMTNESINDPNNNPEGDEKSQTKGSERVIREVDHDNMPIDNIIYLDDADSVSAEGGTDDDRGDEVKVKDNTETKHPALAKSYLLPASPIDLTYDTPANNKGQAPRMDNARDIKIENANVDVNLVTDDVHKGRLGNDVTKDESKLVNDPTEETSDTDCRDEDGKPIEKPFRCVLCGKNFALPYGLTEHMRTHTGEKPYPCTICRRAFSKKNNLKRHMLTHSGRRDHQCHLCDRAFSLPQSLKAHFKMHPSFPGLPFKCEQCGDDFMTRKDMNIHKSIRHSKTCQRYFPPKNGPLKRTRIRKRPTTYTRVNKLVHTTTTRPPCRSISAENTRMTLNKEARSPKAASPEDLTSSEPNAAAMMAVRSVLRTADAQTSQSKSSRGQATTGTPEISPPGCMDIGRYAISPTRPSPPRNKRKSQPKRIERLSESLRMAGDDNRESPTSDDHLLQGRSARGNDFPNATTHDFVPQPIGVKEEEFTASHGSVVPMVTSGGDKRFECDECGKVMTTASNLRIHKIIHTGEKPFKCGDCEAAYANPSSLNRHKRSLKHFSGEMQFPCAECGQAFTSEISLRRHERNSMRHRILFVNPTAGKIPLQN